MSKNDKAREKRRHQKIARTKSKRDDRLAAYRQERLRQSKAKQVRQELLKSGTRLPPLSGEEYVFWLCHGANYLVSDSSEGLWNPLFEDIYQGVLPEAESIAQRVLNHFPADDLENFGGVPRAVLAWTVADLNIVSVYKHEAVRRLLAADPTCDAEALARKPHNPVVWAMMDVLKAKAVQASGVQTGDEDGATEVPSESPVEPPPE